MDRFSLASSMKVAFIKCSYYHSNKILISGSKRNVYKKSTGIVKGSQN